VSRVRCLLGHSNSIWDAALLPTAVSTETLSPTLITCAGDGTIRVWSLGSDNPHTPANLSQTSALRGVLVAGKEDTNENSWLENGKPAQRRVSLASGLTSVGTAADGRDEVQLKCLRISHDGRHVAVGDACGNVRVYDLTTLTLIACKEAHEGPVLSLDYSHPTPGNAGGLVCIAHCILLAAALMSCCSIHSASFLRVSSWRTRGQYAVSIVPN
jgi:WD40 repeat protein